MKAVRIHAHGGPEVITIEDIPVPEPKENEVLFKVTSSCINYADVQWRLGNGDPTLPTTLGREAAGTIEKVGPGVTALQVGQNITARSLGGNADYAIAQVTNAFVCPDGLDMAEAGGIPIIFLTAYHLLRSLVKVNPGDTVLVQAGASGVGSILLQMCKVWGFKSITTASNEAKLQLCRDLGADETINYTAVRFPDRGHAPDQRRRGPVSAGCGWGRSHREKHEMPGSRRKPGQLRQRQQQPGLAAYE